MACTSGIDNSMKSENVRMQNRSSVIYKKEVNNSNNNKII